MANAKRASIHLSEKRNVNPSVNRQTEVTAEDFKEIAALLNDHAELIDAANLNPEKFYKFHTSLATLSAAHPNAEENGWAVIIPTNGNAQFVATFENGQWIASENEAPVQLFNTIADRPYEGQEGVFYIVQDKKIIYLWYNNKWNGFGKDGNNGLSAYQVAVSRGYIGTIDEWLQTLEGKSAYQLAKAEGFEGTQSEWIESLGGIPGKSAYQSALDNGFEGTESEWLTSLLGPQGKSAYQSALDDGFQGTESEWLTSLIGKKGDPGLSAYEDWLSRNNQGTFEEFLETLKAPAGDVSASELESAKLEAIDSQKISTVATSRILADTDHKSILMITASVTLTNPGNLRSNFTCDLDVTDTGQLTINDSAGDGSTLDFPSGKILQAEKMGTIYRRPDNGLLRGKGEFSE